MLIYMEKKVPKRFGRHQCIINQGLNTVIEITGDALVSLIVATFPAQMFSDMNLTLINDEILLRT